MGRFLDKFESFILNYARRVISFLILAALVISVIIFLRGVTNYFDSANLTSDDSFEIPTFSEPVKRQVSVETQSQKTPTENAEQSQNTEPSWQHPMPAFADEIDEVVDEILPLYIAFFGFADSEEDRQKLVKHVVVAIEPFTSALTDSQISDVVDGLVEYNEEFSEYYIKEFEIPSKLSKITEKSDDEFQEILKNPYVPYFEEVEVSYVDLMERVEEEELEALRNNRSAGDSLTIVGGLLGTAIILVLLLLVFKTENSLRRTADTLEAQNK